MTTVEAIKLDTAEEVARWLRFDYPTISPRQIRQWAHRHHITRHPGDLYHAVEVATYLEQRSDVDKRRAVGVSRCAASRRLTL